MLDKGPKDNQVLILSPMNVTVHGKVHFTGVTTDLEIGRLFWAI